MKVFLSVGERRVAYLENFFIMKPSEKSLAKVHFYLLFLSSAEIRSLLFSSVSKNTQENSKNTSCSQRQWIMIFSKFHYVLALVSRMHSCACGNQWTKSASFSLHSLFAQATCSSIAIFLSPRWRRKTISWTPPGARVAIALATNARRTICAIWRPPRRRMQSTIKVLFSCLFHSIFSLLNVHITLF